MLRLHSSPPIRPRSSSASSCPSRRRKRSHTPHASVANRSVRLAVARFCPFPSPVPVPCSCRSAVRPLPPSSRSGRRTVFLDDRCAAPGGARVAWAARRPNRASGNHARAALALVRLPAGQPAARDVARRESQQPEVRPRLPVAPFAELRLTHARIGTVAPHLAAARASTPKWRRSCACTGSRATSSPALRPWTACDSGGRAWAPTSRPPSSRSASSCSRRPPPPTSARPCTPRSTCTP